VGVLFMLFFPSILESLECSACGLIFHLSGIFTVIPEHAQLLVGCVQNIFHPAKYPGVVDVIFSNQNTIFM
jgi:hypothetical protein